MGKKKKGGVAAPSGLGISRNGTKFTFTWKRGTSYTSQSLQYRVNRGGWRGLGVAKGATSAAINNGSAIRVQFRVQGKKKKWSAWATSGEYTCAAPVNGSASNEKGQSDDFLTTFKWDFAVSDTDNKPFSKIEWQSIVVQDSNTSDGSSVNWEGAESGTSTIATGDDAKKEFKESGWAQEEYSYTRWFRVRAVGIAGTSDWRYSRRVFAIPASATNVTARRTQLSDGGFTVMAEWDSPDSEAHPIDSVTIRYRKSTPVVIVTHVGDADGEVKMEIQCPDNDSDWKALNDVGGASGKHGITFTDLNDIGTDQCLFLQVNNTHDSQVKYGSPILVENGTGKIAAPSVPVVTPPGSTDFERLYTVSVTRNTAIDNAAIAVYFRYSSEQDNPILVGIIQPTESSTNCIIPEYPDGDSISFGVRTFVGGYFPGRSQSATEPTAFELRNTLMTSDTIWGEGVPLPPKNIALVKIDESTVQVGWEWSWKDANSAELSWADHKDAWESTNEPSTYNVGSNNVGRWNIAGLGVGTWYIRVRLFKQQGESVTYGAYSDIQTIKLASSPDTPSLVLSDGVIPSNGSVTCYWAYVSTDGTAQKQGEVCEAFPEYEAVTSPTGSPVEQVYYELVDDKYVRSYDTTVDASKTYYRTTGNVTYGEPIASTVSAQHITLQAEDYGWASGETHHLAVRVMSVSGEASEGWSAPVPVTIAEEIECHITGTSLVTETDPYDEDRTIISLKAMPLTITAEGADIGGSTTYIIERAKEYHLDRPDESEYEGFEGETIFMKTVSVVSEVDDDSGEVVVNRSVTINQEDLIGVLDDGAAYRIIAIAKDSYGQTAQDTLEFEVHWTHQAVIPTAEITVEPVHHVTFIKPLKPEEWEYGDVCDIYRLSPDKPELIVKDASFETTYVDPYPSLGEFGGHRIVYRTINGDYITAEDELAWTDYDASENEEYKHDLFGLVIDFDGEQLILPYNVSFGNSWNKDFTTTKYLGGSIQGDWNSAVERTASGSTVIPVEYDPTKVSLMRALASYAGICHVRMPDGSSFTANVNVKDDREEKWTRRLSKVSLDISACDAEGFDGMTYDEWIDSLDDGDEFIWTKVYEGYVTFDWDDGDSSKYIYSVFEDEDERPILTEQISGNNSEALITIDGKSTWDGVLDYLSSGSVFIGMPFGSSVDSTMISGVAIEAFTDEEGWTSQRIYSIYGSKNEYKYNTPYKIEIYYRYSNIEIIY